MDSRACLYSFLVSFLHLEWWVVEAAAACPQFTRNFSEIGLNTPAQYTGACPMTVVSSEAICLESFCSIIKSNINCHGNALQYTALAGGKLGNCYILQLHSCNPQTECGFGRDVNSQVHLTETSYSGTDLVHCPSEKRCVDGECVGILKRCDGVRDCRDGSDEFNCEDTVPCDSDENRLFQCRSSVCIPQSMVCDGKISCPDGSDEMGCSEYLRRRNTSATMMITAIAVGVVLSLLLIVLMFACGQKLYNSHFHRRERLRNLRLGSSGADYVVRLLPGEAPFQDTLPPSYTDSILAPPEEPPGYRSSNPLERLLDIAQSSGYISPLSPKTSDIPSEDLPLSETAPGPAPGPAMTSDKTNIRNERVDIKTEELEIS